jgi:hypothetical protein
LAQNEARANPPEYYGTDTQRLALDTSNLPDGTTYYVFDADTKALLKTYVWVSGIADWGTL